MMSSFNEKLFFTQKVRILKKFSNDELNLFCYFYQKTKINPDNIIYFPPFVFFFVKSEDYFKAITHLRSLRILMKNKKILIIRSEITLLNLLFSFFPDTYIHDIKASIHDKGICEIKVIFFFYEDRRIAIGKNGYYIKILNEIFNEYINVRSNGCSIKIKCVIINS
jgi:hypothetical protein